jgi:hypothetical protein
MISTKLTFIFHLFLLILCELVVFMINNYYQVLFCSKNLFLNIAIYIVANKDNKFN